MSKPKLFITPEVVFERNISKDFIESLKQWFDVHTVEGKKEISRHELLENIKGAFAILCSAGQPMNEEIAMAAGPSLKVISQPAAGFNNIDQEAMKKHSIRVGLAGSAVTAATAELAITILLAASRRIVQFGVAYKKNPATNFQPKIPPVAGLQNSTVGVIGAGRIGYSIAKKLVQFDIKELVYWNRSEKSEFKALGGRWTSMENVAKDSDYVIVTLAYNKDTEKIIGKKIIDLMKPSAVLVNISRGGLVDQDYLVEALKNNKIGGAALDVTTPEPLPSGHPLLQFDNVVISPHLGGLTTVANELAAKTAVENIIAVLNNKPMPDELKM